MADKPNYVDSAATADLKARQEVGNENPSTILSTFPPLEAEKSDTVDEDARDMKVEDNDTDAFLGADPVYVNYGIEQNKAYRTEEGPEAAIDKIAYGEEGVYSAPENPSDDADDTDDSGSKTEPTPSGDGGAQTSGDSSAATNASPEPAKKAAPSKPSTNS